MRDAFAGPSFFPLACFHVNIFACLCHHQADSSPQLIKLPIFGWAGYGLGDHDKPWSIFTICCVLQLYFWLLLLLLAFFQSQAGKRRLNKQSSFDGEHFLRRVFLWLERSIDRQHSLWLLPRVRTSRFDLQRLL